jgi:hypothetical protein
MINSRLLVSYPAGMTIDPETGAVQWAPTDFGTYPVTIEVQDVMGQSATQSFTIAVAPTAAALPPVITTVPVTGATFTVPYTQPITATDPQAETLTYVLTVHPQGMTINAASGLIQYTPNGIGMTPVTVVATNTSGLSATLSYNLTVHANVPPTFTSQPVMLTTAGTPYEYDATATDLGDTFTFSLSTAGGATIPAGMTIDPILGRLTWNPTIAQIGTYPILVVVTNSGGLWASQPYNLKVQADTTPPTVVVQVSSIQIPIGTSFTVLVRATDDVGVTSLGLTANGTPVALGTDGMATLKYNTPGPVTLIGTATDAAGNVGTNMATPFIYDPTVTQQPVVTLANPADGADVTGPENIVWTVTDPANSLVSWTLSLHPTDIANGTLPKTIATGTTSVVNATLGTLDATLLENGFYTLTLTAANAGNLTATVTNSFQVDAGLKLGNFSKSFTDLTLHVAGIPITITRTYDTLRDWDREGDITVLNTLKLHIVALE